MKTSDVLLVIRSLDDAPESLAAASVSDAGAVGAVSSGVHQAQVGGPVVGPNPVYVVHLERAGVSPVVKRPGDPVGF